jgi:protein SCO1/2
MKTVWKVTSLIVFTSLLVLAGYLFSQRMASDYTKDLQTTTVFDSPREVGAFKLIDTQGKAFTEKDLAGHWSMLFFGFTRCPMICPTTMTAMNQVVTQLKDAPKPQVWFISIDPNRDSLKRIRRYVTGFNTDFMGATGSKKELDKLTKQLNVLYMQVKGNDKSAGEYNIDHSASIMLINPEGKLQGIFSTPPEADKISHDYELITSHYKGSNNNSTK